MVLALGLTAWAYTPLEASDAIPTPMSSALEIRDDRCGPLLLLVPASTVFQLRIENISSSDRVLALPPDGTSVSIGSEGFETISMQLEPGRYRVSCDATGNADMSVMMEAVGSEVFEAPPATPLATPISG